MIITANIIAIDSTFTLLVIGYLMLPIDDIKIYLKITLKNQAFSLFKGFT